MILILTCINSNHQTFILFLAFLLSPGVQGLDKIYNVKLVHFKKVGFAWIAFQIFQIRCIRRPKSIQSKRQKRADQNHFRTIQSLQSSGQRGSPRSHLTKRLVREQKWSWEKVKWRIPPLSLHHWEAARKLRPPRPWPPMHLAALCTVRCADRPLQYRLWLPINTYLNSIQYLTYLVYSIWPVLVYSIWPVLV